MRMEGMYLWRVCVCRIRMDGGNVHVGNGGLRIVGTKKASDVMKNHGSL